MVISFIIYYGTFCLGTGVPRLYAGFGTSLLAASAYLWMHMHMRGHGCNAHALEL